MGETALQQFSTRVRRVLGEYFPQHAPNPYKYVSEANVNVLAYKFDLSGFLPSDAMVKREAEIQIQAGNIRETAVWCEAFAGFHQATGDAYRLDCNISILEKALQGRCPTAELLMQIASEKAAQVQMTATATAQAERDQKHEALFHELAPRLITDIPAGSNRYAVALENKRLEERRQQIWNMSLEELQAIKEKRDLRDLPKSELVKIANSMDPARKQRELSGERNTTAEPEQVLKLRAQGEAEVASGRYAKIPAQWRVPGKDVYLDFSFGLLNQLPKEMVKQLIERYGDSQITAACHTTRYKLLQRQQGQ
jgi:hypothetical protein